MCLADGKDMLIAILLMNWNELHSSCALVLLLSFLVLYTFFVSIHDSRGVQ